MTYSSSKPVTFHYQQKSNAAEWRIVSTSEHLQKCVEALGPPDDRPVRHQRQQPTAPVLLADARREVTGSGRAVSVVGRDATLRASSLRTLIPSVLRKLDGSRNVELILVAPNWLAQVCFPWLLEMILHHPRRLPRFPALLKQSNSFFTIGSYPPMSHGRGIFL